jgi:NADPH-dependent 2,4-dienoyl-CoA reductase/sulfur reductase-like enzyme/nitrite reductase/ring-hydroxylating ferredoxin subunit
VVIAPFGRDRENPMSNPADAPEGPDLTQGVSLTELAEGVPFLGHVGNAPALLVRRGAEVLAVGATCTHYGGPLAEGLVVDDTIRCPWHHACFSLRFGAVLRPPALNPLPSWRVEQRDGTAFVREERQPLETRPPSGADRPTSIVIVGGGAAGHAAAETLRAEGYAGTITVLSADAAPPCDRPNLSKDYLAGTAQPDWIPLRPPEFYSQHEIDLRLATPVAAIAPAEHSVLLADGSRLPYSKLLLATGAEPIRLDVPGALLPHVHVLRTLADSDAIIALSGRARRCVVVGASFIGLEVAASLRTRGLEVHVVAPEERPMERIMGAAIGDMVRRLHESHGVRFHLSATVATITQDAAALSTGEQLAADLVVIGIGVRPAVGLAAQAGLAVDRGVVVDEFLQTSAADVYAAGDIARWPDRLTGHRIRVEHWVVAQRQGRTAARNMLGARERYDAVPFFWSQHYDTAINYVGHAESWDRLDIDGDPSAHDCAVTFWDHGRRDAVATVGRDMESLQAEAALEQQTVP